MAVDIEIDLQQVLSLIGINIPQLPNTGSLPEFPKKIKLKEVKGTVVNQITNEPIPGVLVTNKLLQQDTTNKKGEFSIKHPDIANTGFDPVKFPLKFFKLKYSSFNTVPYTSVGDIKPNLGIITLNPAESNLKKEITDLLRFPPSTVEDYATKDVTFEFTIQKKLNVSIDDLKGIVIPLVLGLIAAYGISEVKKIIEKSKINPAEAFDEIKNIITCPTKEEMDKLIATKNKIVKKLNDTLKVITQTTDALTISEKILAIASPTIKTIRQLPTPTSIPPGIGIPLNVIITIQDTLKFLDSLVEKLLYVNSTTLAILTLLRSVLSQVVDFLNLLDLLIQFCNESSPNQEIAQAQISNELILLTNEQSNQLSPVVTNVNGFTMGVETEVTDKPLKRRRATATNKQGVVMLVGEWSFSSIDQILIDELVFYIQQNNLKAD
jgi:hypothetical protein